MVTKIQNIILDLNDFIHSITVEFVELFIVAIIFYLLYLNRFLKKKKNDRSKLEKLLLIPFSAVLALFFIIFIFAGDIYPINSPEKIARYFAEHLNKGEIEYLKEDYNRFFTSKYFHEFMNEGDIDFNELYDIQCNFKDFRLVEYHLKNRGFSNPGECIVVLKVSFVLLSDIFDIATQGIDQSEYCDYYFKISMKEVILNSRFLGKYVRWRIDGFSYTKSNPYKLIDFLYKLTGPIENEEIDKLIEDFSDKLKGLRMKR